MYNFVCKKNLNVFGNWKVVGLRSRFKSLIDCTHSSSASLLHTSFRLFAISALTAQTPTSTVSVCRLRRTALLIALRATYAGDLFLSASKGTERGQTKHSLGAHVVQAEKGLAHTSQGTPAKKTL